MRFSDAIRKQNNNGSLAVIPDIKCISPKEGDMLKGRNPVAVAGKLVAAGAHVLSVVTEKDNYAGSPELLRAVAESTNVPVLRKDFIKTTDEIERTLEYGASAVLLICAIMPQELLKTLYDKAMSIGLEPFVEVCNEQEMQFAKTLGAGLIGINNRDITTLELDDNGPERTVKLAAGAPPGAVLVSESGILTTHDVKTALYSGVNAVLVGTALWQSENICLKYKSFLIPYKTAHPCRVKICGLMCEQDIEMCINHNVDMLGFVVNYPHPVPWNISEDTAKQLIAKAAKRKETCIVTGGKPDDVAELALKTGTDYVQLHTRASVNETKELAEKLRVHKVKVIKTIFPDTPDTEAEALAETGVYALLLDSRVPEDAKNSGKADIAQYMRLCDTVSCPIILAGGLDETNIADYVSKTNPQIIDVMTGIEKSPGVKDEEKLIRLMKVLNNVLELDSECCHEAAQ